MLTPKSILLGLELSGDGRCVASALGPPAQLALRQATQLANRCGAKLRLMTVLPDGADQWDAETEVLLEEQHGKTTVWDVAQSRLSELAELARQEGVVHVDTQVESGAVVPRLVEEARAGKHDLIVVGTKPQNSLKRWIVGSTGQSLLKQCQCPVWVARPPEDMKSVLIAHDLGPVGDAAYQRAAALAQCLQVPLHVLHVLPQPAAPGTDPAASGSEAEASARTQLKQRVMGGEISEAKIFVVRHASIERAILEHLQQHAVDVLVLGTVGRLGLRRRVLGTTAEHLLAQTEVSVLAVTPDGIKGSDRWSSEELEPAEPSASGSSSR